MAIKTQQMMLGDICIDVLHKNIKNLCLSIYPPTGRVRISAPKRMSLRTIRIFAISKLEWIKKHRAKFLQQEIEPPIKYLSHESHYFKGKRYLLNVINHNAPPKVELRKEAYIDLYIRKGSNLEHRKKAITEWYRKQLKDSIPDLIEKWQKIMDVEIKDWGIKQMKTRWGTCNIKAHRIWLNLELIKKPEYCLEYIVVHEILHLLERRHDIRYKSYMDKFIPQWRIYEKELNRLKP
ncbi:MAG: SprT family zinc-dependent metalloprotease [Candidatus Kaelpia aquatica]|nr:SprT family zinc-dependent metalloprotease [Candidatus Kaelpia aquatica]